MMAPHQIFNLISIMSDTVTHILLILFVSFCRRLPFSVKLIRALSKRIVATGL